MEGVQNLRKAVYEWVARRLLDLTPSFKLKVDAAEPGSVKFTTLQHQAINYLYRCGWARHGEADPTSDGTLIVLANFLLEAKDRGVPLDKADFPQWLEQHREIRNVLSRKNLD